jgi:type IV pilus assembly protein PilM
MSKNIVGIDIGNSSVRAVELKNADKGKPVVVNFHEVELPQGSVRRGEVLEPQAVSAALKRLWSTGGFTTKDVILGMGGPRVLSRDLAMPKAPLGRIKEALPFHVQDLLPVPVDEAILDFYPIAEFEGDNGTMVSGLLIAAIKEAVAANIAAVTGAGLRPVQVDLIPFALVRALAPVGGATGLTAVVSIGANTTNVVIAHDGVPHFVRIIPSGGADITGALVKRLDIAPEAAESIKRELGLQSAGTTPDQRPAVEAIYESVGELLTSIRNTISYYVNSKPGLSVGRIVLSGGGSSLPGLVHALAEITGILVEHAEPLGGAQLSRGSQKRSSREEQDGMATAFALALGTTV